MAGQNEQIRPYPLGAHPEGEGIRFSFVSESSQCGIFIYDRNTGRKIDTIPFLEEQRIGNIHCAYVTKYSPDEIAYQFYEDSRVVPDERAVSFAGSFSYGRERKERDLRAGFLKRSFDWGPDRNPRIPYRDAVCYLLHVRGFTRHVSSGVRHRGTFRGIQEKLSYLQEIGVTTIELQPAYEFLEIPSREERMALLPYPAKEEDLDTIVPLRLNYWGYKKGYYYAPKAAYAADCPETEFKELVRELHRRGMELVMQFYFPKEIPVLEISDILRYWLIEYHVDGFHLMGENLPADLFAGDPILAETKLWYDRFHTAGANLASYQDDFLYAMRKFLKGDEGMVESALYQMRQIPESGGRIHFLSNYYGLTLQDMVSYDRKHNEDNGEENRDGTDDNCSWNCGEEGNTRKKKVTALRKRMIKNAMCFLLLSQSTPLIFMGDEFGNSQKGNNNPYCQDNPVTWLDWRDLERNREIHEFWKLLISLRKQHPVLHPGKAAKVMDYMACGYPDLSYHGESAWRPETERYSRTVGVMYCGKYEKVSSETEDDFFYLAVNMHWEVQKLGLPRLPVGLKWELMLTTKENSQDGREKEPKEAVQGENSETWKDIVQSVSPRTILLFHSVADEKAENKSGKRCAKNESDRTIF